MKTELIYSLLLVVVFISFSCFTEQSVIVPEFNDNSSLVNTLTLDDSIKIKMNGISAEFEITNTEYKAVKTYNFLNYIKFLNIHDSFSEIERKTIDNEEATQEKIKKTNSSDIAKML